MISTATIRVKLPYHLRTLARVRVGTEVMVDVAGAITLRSVLDTLEENYPMLRGTIRDHVTQQRRAYLRFFASGRDLSHDSPDDPLPDRIVSGQEPLIVLGAIAGG
jgi:sulfur-carrier protein